MMHSGRGTVRPVKYFFLIAWVQDEEEEAVLLNTWVLIAYAPFLALLPEPAILKESLDWDPRVRNRSSTIPRRAHTL